MEASNQLADVPQAIDVRIGRIGSNVSLDERQRLSTGVAVAERTRSTPEAVPVKCSNSVSTLDDHRVAGRRTVSPTRTTSTVTFPPRGSCFAGRSFMNDQVAADLATDLA
jgi:hypothetical protein